MILFVIGYDEHCNTDNCHHLCRPILKEHPSNLQVVFIPPTVAEVIFIILMETQPIIGFNSLGTAAILIGVWGTNRFASAISEPLKPDREATTQSPG